MTPKIKPGIGIAIIFVFVVFAFFAITARGDPVGVDLLSSFVDGGPNKSYSRADEGGTISTLSLNVSQQTAVWKGYVGNVTGQLVLQDSLNYTLYDWQLTTINGEVFATRASSVTWSSIGCANYANISAEYTPLSMSESDVDSINQTFIYQNHSQFTVAGTTLNQDTCPSIATYLNSTAQVVNTTADFQEVLLDDDLGLVYATILEQDTAGYHDLWNYDFQMIIPDSDAAATQTTYYFWAEIN